MDTVEVTGGFSGMRWLLPVGGLTALVVLIAACTPEVAGSPDENPEAIEATRRAIDLESAPVRVCGEAGLASHPAAPPDDALDAGAARFRVGDPQRFEEGFFAPEDDGRHPGVKIPLYIAGGDGREVVLSIPPPWRDRVGMVYVPETRERAERAEDGVVLIGEETDHTIVFVPCEDADWSFFSGGFAAVEAACVPVDVFDGVPVAAAPQRVWLPLTAEGCP